jgi:flagellar motor switch protein FliN/FliY
MSSSPISSSSSKSASVESPFADLLDATCSVQVLLGSGSISVRRCLELERDSIIRLPRAAGDDLLVTANGVPLARGEVVVVEESTAIRVTDIVGGTVTEAG